MILFIFTFLKIFPSFLENFKNTLFPFFELNFSLKIKTENKVNNHDLSNCLEIFPIFFFKSK